MAKISRNTPCPFGSGKRYEKCCGKPCKEVERDGGLLIKSLSAENEEKRIEIFEKILSSEDQDESVCYSEIYLVVINYYKSRDIDKAIKYAGELVEYDIKYENGMNKGVWRIDLGELLIRKGDIENGMKIFKELIKEEPDDVWIYNALGYSLPRAGMYDEAIKYIRKGIELSKKQGDAEGILNQLEKMLEENISKRDKRGPTQPG